MRVEVTGKLIIDNRAREWCKLPYPNHKNGCPNYNKKVDCPPQALLIKDFLDLNKPHWFFWIVFNLKEHADKMKAKHRNWTERQCRNVLYWQNSVRAQLEKECVSFCAKTQTVFTLIPEAMGVHVIMTAKKVNIPIQTRPKDLVHKIALVGYPKTPLQGSLDDWLFTEVQGD